MFYWVDRRVLLLRQNIVPLQVLSPNITRKNHPNFWVKDRQKVIKYIYHVTGFFRKKNKENTQSSMIFDNKILRIWNSDWYDTWENDCEKKNIFHVTVLDLSTISWIILFDQLHSPSVNLILATKIVRLD